MIGSIKNSPRSWLAFDLNVLGRLKFASASLPFCETPALASYLKRLNVRVAANDPLRSAWTMLEARVANDRERLTGDDVEAILSDAYVPGYQHENPSLLDWFSETDAWWFDNVKRNIASLGSPMKQAIASTAVFAVGDHALSFKGEVRKLRQPLSTVFRRVIAAELEPFNNGESNVCTNLQADAFIAENPAELLFLRLPVAHATDQRTYMGQHAWREEWVRGDSSWDRLEKSFAGKLGGATETKSQYLDHLAESLDRATHIRTWAVAHVETGLIAAQDIVDVVSNLRRVETVYTKDFSELTGTKAVMITA